MRISTPQIPAPPPREIALFDAELYRLARGAGRLRLRIGQALHRLGGGFHELGFSTLGAYALECCCRGGRWAAESRTLARRLQSLPRLTKALDAGSIGWSMAELLARHATPQTEAAPLQVARGKTVQAMRIALSPQESPEPPDDDELARTLSLTVPLEEAWALDRRAHACIRSETPMPHAPPILEQAVRTTSRAACSNSKQSTQLPAPPTDNQTCSTHSS